MAIVMPGIGPIVAAGPLAAGLGEAAGHVAGSVASVMQDAGIPESAADDVQRAIENGAVLLGIHCTSQTADHVRDVLAPTCPTWLSVATWK